MHFNLKQKIIVDMTLLQTLLLMYPFIRQDSHHVTNYDVIYLLLFFAFLLYIMKCLLTTLI